jgi:hypothetical protein
MSDDTEAKVVSVHYQPASLMLGDGVEATVTLDDGRTGSARSYTAERAAREAASDAQNSK